MTQLSEVIETAEHRYEILEGDAMTHLSKIIETAERRCESLELNMEHAMDHFSKIIETGERRYEMLDSKIKDTMTHFSKAIERHEGTVLEGFPAVAKRVFWKKGRKGFSHERFSISMIFSL